MKPLIFYYSRTGRTEKLARLIATQTRAEIIRIDPETEYGTFGDSLSRVMRERMRKSKNPAVTPVPDLERFNPIFIGFPIWCGDMPGFMKDFLSKCNLKGKTVIPFATYAWSGIHRALQTLKKAAPEAKIVLPFEDGLISGSKYKTWRLELRRYMRTMDE